MVAGYPARAPPNANSVSAVAVDVGWWPMSNWLDAFEQRGLIVRDSECPANSAVTRRTTQGIPASWFKPKFPLVGQV